MAKRRAKRDYKAEYARRIARGLSKGLDRSVARGHSRRGLVGIRLAKQYKVSPGSRIADLPIRSTGRSVSDDLIDRERELLIDQGISIKEINAIDFHDEESFIKKLLELGYTSREAYQLRFSP
jgi:hypothetical protein